MYTTLFTRKKNLRIQLAMKYSRLVGQNESPLFFFL